LLNLSSWHSNDKFCVLPLLKTSSIAFVAFSACFLNSYVKKSCHVKQYSQISFLKRFLTALLYHDTSHENQMSERSFLLAISWREQVTLNEIMMLMSTLY